MFALSVYFTFRSNGQNLVSGQNFPPQAKYRETSHNFHSLSEKFFGGWGLSFKKVPASPVSLVSLHKGIISGRIISSPTNPQASSLVGISSPAVRIGFLPRKPPHLPYPPYLRCHFFCCLHQIDITRRCGRSFVSLTCARTEALHTETSLPFFISRRARSTTCSAVTYLL